MAALQMNPRDFGVLSDLGEYGFLDTPMIHALRFRGVTMRRCRQKLAQYLEHDLIVLCPPLVTYSRTGHAEKVPHIYALSERGAELVESHFGLPVKRILRSKPKPETIMHRLELTRLRIAFDGAFRRSELTVPEWILEQDCRDDLPDNVPPNQRSMLFHRFQQDGQIYSCRPDAVCRFALPIGASDDMVPLVFYWEIDRSTEGHKQIRKQKISGHTELIKQQSWVRYWPDLIGATARILYTTRSEERSEKLATTYRPTSVSRFVRFGELHCVTAAKALLQPIWLDCEGQRRRIWNGRTP